MVSDLFVAQGIDASRLILPDQGSRRHVLELYNQIDIGLDTIPYNGHSTSCESFWMGVPVITLAGSTTVGRAGVSLLKNLGLGELIAQNVEEFVKICCDVATDLPRLANRRGGLRNRMRNSPLMDEVGYTRDLEERYREMWRTSCAKTVRP